MFSNLESKQLSIKAKYHCISVKEVYVHEGGGAFVAILQPREALVKIRYRGL